MVDLWTEAVRSIEPMVKPAHRDLWLRPITCLGISNGRIQLRAPNRYHKEWFEDNFLPSILRDIEARSNQSFTVDFELVEDSSAARPAPSLKSHALSDGGAGELRPADSRWASSPRGDRARAGWETGRDRNAGIGRPPPPDLLGRYNFDTFVVGPTNQFAHAAARMVADAPASRWNPLFIYGGGGVGKKHPLQAAGGELPPPQPQRDNTAHHSEKVVPHFIRG